MFGEIFFLIVVPVIFFLESGFLFGGYGKLCLLHPIDCSNSSERGSLYLFLFLFQRTVRLLSMENLPMYVLDHSTCGRIKVGTLVLFSLGLVFVHVRRRYVNLGAVVMQVLSQQLSHAKPVRGANAVK